jgi:hypothetical protein
MSTKLNRDRERATMAHVCLNDKCGQGSRECHVIEDHHEKTNVYHDRDGEVS